VEHRADEGPARSGWLRRGAKTIVHSSSPGALAVSQATRQKHWTTHHHQAHIAFSPFHPILSPISPSLSPPSFPSKPPFSGANWGGKQLVSARKSSVGFPSAALVSPALLGRSASPASLQKTARGSGPVVCAAAAAQVTYSPALDPSSDPWTPAQHQTSPEPESCSEFSPSLTTSPHFSQTKQSHRCDVHCITRQTCCGSRQGEQLERRTRAHPIPVLLPDRITQSLRSASWFAELAH